MKRRRCELILPASEYDGMPLVADENDGHKYHKGEKGRYLKLSRKTCNMCASPVLFVGIFKYKSITGLNVSAKTTPSSLLTENSLLFRKSNLSPKNQ
jgi:hypothetical protein